MVIMMVITVFKFFICVMFIGLLVLFQDSYYMLTKKLLESLHEVRLKYSADYVMKCDDDTFVHTGLFLNKLRGLPTSMLYWGYFTGK